MAPIGMAGMLSWCSSVEVGIISLVVFLILSITLLALCVKCHRNTSNAYAVSGDTNDGANGSAGTKTAGSTDPGTAGHSTWRNHRNMPPSTLERSTANK